MADRVPAGLTAAEGRTFAFTVGIAFGLFGAIAGWREHQRMAMALGSLGGLLLLLGVTVPSQLGPVQRAWMGLAHLISKVTTPIFMGVVYFVVITPIALIMGVVGKRPLRVRTGNSYWQTRAPHEQRSDLTRQF